MPCDDSARGGVPDPTFARTINRMSVALDLTEFLKRASHGDARAVDALIPKIYGSLRQLARRQRARESAHTLETTALVHETYLVLSKQADAKFEDSAHFYAYVSQVMRHLLVDHARRHKAMKRQAPERIPRDGARTDAIVDVLALDEALRRLAAADPRLARVVELRLFAELGHREIAELFGVTERTIERDWLKARTFLGGCLLREAH